MSAIAIRLPLAEAMQACSAVLPHISAGDVTPVLTAASIQGNTITATDRYSVGKYELSESLGDGSILLPHEAVKWIARFVTKHLLGHPVAPSGYSVTVTGPDPSTSAKINPENILVQVESELYGVEASRMFRPIFGKFPPVDRLFEQHTPATVIPKVGLGPNQLEKFTAYAKKWHKGAPLQFTLSEGKRAEKPGVVLIELDKFTGLLQPNLLTR